MSAIQSFLFESPWLLIPALAIIEFFLLSGWLRKRTPGSRRALLIGLALCIALPLLQKLVVTRREEVRSVCMELVQATEDGDVNTIADRVAPAFQVREIDRDRFVEGVTKTLTNSSVEHPRLHGMRVVIDGDRAEVHFVVTCRIVTPEGMEGGVPSAWEVIFQRINDQWLMIAVEPRATPLFPFDRLEQLLG